MSPGFARPMSLCEDSGIGLNLYRYPDGDALTLKPLLHPQ
jgi:hypothetical protein